MSRKCCSFPRRANRKTLMKRYSLRADLFLNWMFAFWKFLLCHRHCDVVNSIKSSVLSKELFERLFMSAVFHCSVLTSNSNDWTIHNTWNTVLNNTWTSQHLNSVSSSNIYIYTQESPQFPLKLIYRTVAFSTGNDKLSNYVCVLATL